MVDGADRVRNAIASGAFALACWVAGDAHAHITLLEPASWLEEDRTGNPQKGSPCGPQPGQAFTPTDAITTYRAGDTITVKWIETIPHPGHFRIALAEARDELTDPTFEYDQNTCYPIGEIEFANEYPVLADNVHPRTSVSAAGTMFTQEVTIPADMTCEKCTLQLIQYMTAHAASCFYYHCADIRIVASEDDLPGEGGAAGEGAAGQGAAGRGASAGAGAGSSPPGSESSAGGCGVAGGADAPASAALTALALLRVRRRSAALTADRRRPSAAAMARRQD
jgi:hypothetical protein